MIAKIKQGNTVCVQFKVLECGKVKDMASATGLSWSVRSADYACRCGAVVASISGNNPYKVAIDTSEASPLGVYFVTLKFKDGDVSRVVDGASFELVAHSECRECSDTDGCCCLAAEVGTSFWLPAGGTAGQALVKRSDEDDDVTWDSVPTSSEVESIDKRLQTLESAGVPAWSMFKGAGFGNGRMVGAGWYNSTPAPIVYYFEFQMSGTLTAIDVQSGDTLGSYDRYGWSSFNGLVFDYENAYSCVEGDIVKFNPQLNVVDSKPSEIGDVWLFGGRQWSGEATIYAAAGSDFYVLNTSTLTFDKVPGAFPQHTARVFVNGNIILATTDGRIVGYRVNRSSEWMKIGESSLPQDTLVLGMLPGLGTGPAKFAVVASKTGGTYHGAIGFGSVGSGMSTTWIDKVAGVGEPVLYVSERDCYITDLGYFVAKNGIATMLPFKAGNYFRMAPWDGIIYGDGAKFMMEVMK